MVLKGLRLGEGENWKPEEDFKQRDSQSLIYGIPPWLLWRGWLESGEGGHSETSEGTGEPPPPPGWEPGNMVVRFGVVLETQVEGYAVGWERGESRQR